MGNSKKPKKSWLARRRGAQIKNEQVMPARNIQIPDDEKEVLKIVDATVNGARIGDAVLYDDGSVDIRLDKDADPELVAVLQGEISDFNIDHGSDFKMTDLFPAKED